LDRHAVFSRRISFSKGSDGLIEFSGFIRRSHEIRATSSSSFSGLSRWERRTRKRQ
jgi:hypothetical protein